MFRTLVRTYALLSLLFVIALAVFFVARLTAIRDQNIDLASRSFSTIRERAERVLSEADSASETKALMRPREKLPAGERLEAVVLYTLDEGVAYLWARSTEYTEEGFTGGSGVPRMDYNEFTQIKLTDTVGVEEGYVVEALFTVVSRPDLYPLLRTSLIAILAVALLATVLAIIGARPTKREPIAVRAEGATHAPGPRSSSSDSFEGRRVGREHSPGEEPLFGPSGLSREEYLLKRLSLELERAAYNEQDLTLTVLEYDGQEPYNEQYLLHARQLLDHFGFEDLAFEMGERFVVIFPNTTLREGLRTVERYKKEILDSGPTTELDHPYAGLSSRNGRLIDGKRLLSEAMVALKKSRDTPGRILGFEPDPEKYRAAL
ncbi:MAG: hypothetical protein ACLFPP_05430 [Spirochaetaceae bacterium]